MNLNFVRLLSEKVIWEFENNSNEHRENSEQLCNAGVKVSQDWGGWQPAAVAGHPGHQGPPPGPACCRYTPPSLLPLPLPHPRGYAIPHTQRYMYPYSPSAPPPPLPHPRGHAIPTRSVTCTHTLSLCLPGLCPTPRGSIRMLCVTCTLPCIMKIACHGQMRGTHLSSQHELSMAMQFVFQVSNC